MTKVMPEESEVARARPFVPIKWIKQRFSPKLIPNVARLIRKGVFVSPEP